MTLAFRSGVPVTDCRPVQHSIPSVCRKTAVVTTSWDDGDALDLRIAEVLRSKGLPATFYIPIAPYTRHPALQRADLTSLSAEGFEVGAHSISHPNLARLPIEDVDHEVRDCKHMLEDVTGRQVQMFCYPNGRYNRTVVQRLKVAGYSGARTTRMLTSTWDFKPFEMPTTLQAYPHSRSAYLRNLTKAGNWQGILRYLKEYAGAKTWVEMGKRLFDRVLEQGGVWHLYGHSWEIEDLDLWRDLQEIVDYVSGREEVMYIPNGKVLHCFETVYERQGVS